MATCTWSVETLWHKVDQTYTVTTLGAVAGTSGPVSMADNGTQLFVACNGPSFIYNALLGRSLRSRTVISHAVTVDYPTGSSSSMSRTVRRYGSPVC